MANATFKPCSGNYDLYFNNWHQSTAGKSLEQMTLVTLLAQKVMVTYQSLTSSKVIVGCLLPNDASSRKQLVCKIYIPISTTGGERKSNQSFMELALSCLENHIMHAQFHFANTIF
jgi:hypothetical protein